MPRRAVGDLHSAALDVLCEVVKDSLQTTIYDAELAGVNVSLQPGLDNDLCLVVDGFDDKVLDVACAVLGAVKELVGGGQGGDGEEGWVRAKERVLKR